MFQVFEGIEAQFVPSGRLAQTIIQSYIETQFRIGERRHKHWHALLISRFQNPALPFRMFRQMRSDGMIQLVRTQHFAVIPTFQNLGHHFFYVVEVLLGLERVVHAVVALLIKLSVGDVRVVAEVSSPGCFDQAVRHERARRDNRIHDSPVDQVCDDETLFGDGHGAGQGHHHEAVRVASHGFEYVGRLAHLATGEGRFPHRTHEIVNRTHRTQVQRLQRNQTVFNRIVQLAVNSCAVMIAILQDPTPTMSKHYSTRTQQAPATTALVEN